MNWYSSKQRIKDNTANKKKDSAVTEKDRV